MQKAGSFVRSFVIVGRGPAYSGPQRWDLYVGPMRQPRERRGIGRCAGSVKWKPKMLVVVDVNGFTYSNNNRNQNLL